MKTISRITLCAMVMTLSAAVAQAQDTRTHERPNREQLAQKQAEHIAHQLALDEATSKKLIDTYVAYQKELWALGPRHQHRQNRQQQQTDAEAEQAIKQRMERSQKMLDLREKYYNIYRQFLTPLQIERVYELEQQAMKRLAKHRKGQGGQGGHDGRRGSRGHKR